MADRRVNALGWIRPKFALIRVPLFQAWRGAIPTRRELARAHRQSWNSRLNPNLAWRRLALPIDCSSDRDLYHDSTLSEYLPIRHGHRRPHGNELHASRSGSRRPAAHTGRLRGMLEDARPLGASAALPHVWPRRLLRQLAGQARDEAQSLDGPPDHQELRAGRGLGLVLRGRALHRARAARLDERRQRHAGGRWRRRGMAGAAARAVVGHVRDAPSVAADRGEDATRARANAEPLVAGHAVPDQSRAHDFADAGGWTLGRSRARLHRSPAHRAYERG